VTVVSVPDNREQFIDVDGRKVRIRVTGEGPPVLLINGLGANVATWTSLVSQLQGFEVISFDAPGVGRSATPKAPYTISRIADVAVRVLEELGHDEADVLGYSLGGAVAQQLAAKHPHRVRRLVLVSSSCGAGAIPGSLPALLAVSTPARHYGQLGYRLSMRMMDLAPAEKESGFVEAQHGAWHREAPPSPVGYLLQMGAFSAFHSLPWLHRVTSPTLVLSGSHDRLMPLANAAVLTAYIPHARLRVFDRWGHYMLHDPASGAGTAVAEFFRAARHTSSSAWKAGHSVDRPAMERYVRAAPGSAHPARFTHGLVRRLSRLPNGGT
jgi:poly(3-hydroxyoctanoate) depolymerase